MIWTHFLQRLDDQCLGLCSPWITGCVSIWPQRVGASPGSVVARRLDDAGAVAWLRRNGCWI